MTGEKTEPPMADEDEFAAEFADAEAAVADIESPDARIVQLESDLAAARQETLYARAEEQNTRRRLEREKADASAYAATGFARDMLSVADNLERALAAIPEELRGDEKMKGLVAGLEATAKELDTVFRKNGVEPIAALGEHLDPHFHQAMIEVPNEDAEPGTIVQEMQRGYTIRDRLLRPSLVGVAKKGG